MSSLESKKVNIYIYIYSIVVRRSLGEYNAHVKERATLSSGKTYRKQSEEYYVIYIYIWCLAV